MSTEHPGVEHWTIRPVSVHASHTLNHNHHHCCCYYQRNDTYWNSLHCWRCNSCFAAFFNLVLKAVYTTNLIGNRVVWLGCTNLLLQRPSGRHHLVNFVSYNKLE